MTMRACFGLIFVALTWPCFAERICNERPRSLFRSSDLVAEAEVTGVTQLPYGTTFNAHVLRLYRGTFSQTRDAHTFAVVALTKSTACCNVSVAKGDRILLYAWVDAVSGMLETDQCRVLTGDAAQRHRASIRRWRWLWRW